MTVSPFSVYLFAFYAVSIVYLPPSLASMPEKIEVVISETTMVFVQNTLRFQEEIRSDVLYCCLVNTSDN